MDIKQRLGNAKPFIYGLVTGAILAAVLGFGSGWTVTAGAKAEAVRLAQIGQLAAICNLQAREYWAAQGEELDALRGWTARQQRETLAREISSPLAIDQALQRDVIRECGRLLDT